MQQQYQISKTSGVPILCDSYTAKIIIANLGDYIAISFVARCQHASNWIILDALKMGLKTYI